MPTLYHQPLDTPSRFVRLALTEWGQTFDLAVENTWERRREYLALNPAATVPVLVDDDAPILVGANAIVGHFCDAEAQPDLWAQTPQERAEIRRLLDWALVLCEQDVTGALVFEKAQKRFIPENLGGGGPDTAAMRFARDHLIWHLDYVNHVLAGPDWLAGERLTLADLAFGAAFSALDYLGEVPWNGRERAKNWYARLKSRPSFVPLLQERVRGVTPPAHYDDPDF